MDVCSSPCFRRISRSVKIFMRNILIVWAVIIVGAALWGVISRPAGLSFFTDAQGIDENKVAASTTQTDIDRILGNSPGRAYRTKKVTEAKVVKVINGDTIEVEIDGAKMTVGYLGVEAPIFEDRIQGTKPFGKEAYERNRELVEGKTVFLEKDLIQIDNKGRLLRYVYNEESMVNAILIREGLVKASRRLTPVKYAEVIYEIELKAINDRNGGWLRTWPSIIQTR